MKRVSEPTRWSMRLIVYGLLLLAGYMASALYADIRIRGTASQFCRGIVEGDNTDSTEQHAMTLGAEALNPRWVYQSEDQTLKLDLLFTGLPPFDGYVCSLYMRNNELVRKAFNPL